MKRFIFSVTFVLYTFFSTLFPLSVLPAKAEQTEQTEQYACALSRDVYFYAEENENSGLFLLPYTYYVKVLRYGTPFSYCSYLTDTDSCQTVYGYCKTDALTFVDYVPRRPYLYYTLDVTYSLPASSPVVKDDFSKITLSYALYGEYTVGSATYLYVFRDGETGYLPKTQEISYELNDDWEVKTPASSDQEELPQEAPDETGGWVLLIVAGLLLACAAAFFFLPKKPQTDEGLITQ